MKLSPAQYNALIAQGADKIAELQDERNRLRSINADLLKALKNLLHAYTINQNIGSAIDVATAIISKCEGK